MNDATMNPVERHETTAFHVLKAVEPGQLKMAVAAWVDGVLQDLSDPVPPDAPVQAVAATS